MTQKSFKKIVLHSSFEEIEKLDPYLEQLQEWASIDDDQLAPIRLAVSEAVINAIVHGNKQDESKKVTLVTSLEKNVLKIAVEDEGPGFDPSKLPDPLKEENLMKESGRGIFLIKQYADDVSFSKNPATLTMQFTLDTPS